MSHFLFAGSEYYPNGGAEDLVGTFTVVTDEVVLAAVVKALQDERIEYYHSLWANSLSFKMETLGERHYWDVFITALPYDPGLAFCSVTQEVEGLGWCGVIPLGLNATNEDGSPSSEVSLYALRDPAKKHIRWLT